jgi:hypothetical protein
VFECESQLKCFFNTNVGKSISSSPLCVLSKQGSDNEGNSWPIDRKLNSLLLFTLSTLIHGVILDSFRPFLIVEVANIY